MAETISEPFFKGSTGRSSRGLLRLIILSLIAAAYVVPLSVGVWLLVLPELHLVEEKDDILQKRVLIIL